jgi:hypothetical protein
MGCTPDALLGRLLPVPLRTGSPPNLEMVMAHEHSSAATRPMHKGKLIVRSSAILGLQSEFILRDKGANVSRHIQQLQPLLFI